LTEHLASIAAKESVKADKDALAMIARAAEGSVRDGLSILDQAIAMSKKAVTAETVRAMLGLADRGRVFDLLEHVFRGDAARALMDMAALYKDGADPVQLTGDLAEAVHVTTRIKVAGDDAGGEGLPDEEKRRAASLAERLSVPLLSRAWQMLLKGLEEVARAPEPLAALEMVLIRLAYTADLPPPDEIIKALTGEGVSVRRGAGASEAAPSERRAPLNESVRQSPAASTQDAPPDQFSSADDTFDAADYGSDRDPKLKFHLEEHVSVVKFDAVAGSIDIFLLPAAPPELANELRERLNKWTGRRWIVMLSKARGERSLGDIRREREAAELARLRQHPAVAAILDTFPDAKITAIREIDGAKDDETGTG
jgi:DNA polymerase-3 subunit gamma/tau